MAAREKKPAVGKQLGNRRDADSSKASLTASTIKKFNSLAEAKKDLLKLSEDVASAIKKPIPGAYVRRRKNSVASVAASEPGVGTLSSRDLLRSSSKINPRVVAKKSGIGGGKITRLRADSLVANGITSYKSPYGMRSGAKGLRSGKRRDGKGLIEFAERPLEYSLKKRKISVATTPSASVPTSANTTPSPTPPGTPVAKSAPNSEPPQQSRPRLLLTELPKTQPLITFDSPSQFLRRNSDSAPGGAGGSPGSVEGVEGAEVDGPDPVLGRAISSKITALIKRSKATAILQKFSEMRAERKAAEAAATATQMKSGDCDKPVDTNSNLCTGAINVDTSNKNVSPAARGTVTKKTLSEGQKPSNLVNEKSSAKTEGKDVPKTPVAVKEASPKTGGKDVSKTPVPVKEVSVKSEGKAIPKTSVAVKEPSTKTESKAVPKTPVTVKGESPKTDGKGILKTSGAVKEATAKTEGKNVPRTPVAGKEESPKIEGKDIPKKLVAVKEASPKIEGKDVAKTPVAAKDIKPQPLKSAMSTTNVKSAGSTVNCKQKENTSMFVTTMKPISPGKSKSPSTKDTAESGKSESVQDTDTEGEPGEPSFPPEGRVRPGMPRPDTPRPKFSRRRREPTKKLAVRRLEVSEGLGVALGGTAVPLGARVTRKRKLGKVGGSEAGERAAKRKRLSPLSTAAKRGRGRPRVVKAGPSGIVSRPGPSGIVSRPGPSGIVSRPGPSGIVSRPGPSGIVSRPGPSGIVSRPGPSEIVSRPGPSGIKRSVLSAIMKRARGRPYVRAPTPVRDVSRSPSTSPEKPESGPTVKKSEEASVSKQVPKTDAKLKTDLPNSMLEVKGEKLLNGDLSPRKQFVDQLKNKLCRLSEENKADIKELKDDPGSEYKLKNCVNDMKEQSNISLKSSKECDYLCLKDVDNLCKPHLDSCTVKGKDSPEKGKTLLTKLNAAAKDLCHCKLPCSKEAKNAPCESSLKPEKKETVFCNKITDTKDDSKKGCVNSVAGVRAATKDVKAVVVKEKEDVVMKEVEDVEMTEVDVPLVSDVNKDCVKMDVVCDNAPKVEVKETENNSCENAPVNNNIIESHIKKASSKSVCASEAASPRASDTKELSNTKLPPVPKTSSTNLFPVTDAVSTELPPVIDAVSTELPPVIDAVSAKLPPVIDAVSTKLPPVIDAISTKLPPVIDAVSTKLPAVIDAVSTKLPAVIDAVSTKLPPVIDAVSTKLPPVIDAASSELPPVIDAASSELPPVIDAASSELPPVIDAASSELPPVIDAASSELPPVIDAASSELPPVIDAASTELPPVIDAASSELPPVIDAASSELPPVIGAASSELPPVIGAASSELPPVIDAASSELPPVIDAASSELPPVIDAASSELPPVIDAASSELPPIIDAASSELPPVIDAASSELPPVIDAASSELPPVIDAASSELPPVIDAASSELPPVIDAASSELPPVIDAASSELPPVIDAASSEIPPVNDAASSEYPLVIDAASSEPPPVIDAASSEPPPVIDDASSEFPPVIDAASSELPMVIDAASSELRPVVDAVSSELPMVIDASRSEFPLVIDESSSELPMVIDEASSELPMVIDDTNSELPPVIDAASSELPPVIDAASSELPPVIDAASSELPPFIDAASSELPPVIDAASADLPPVTDGESIRKPQIIELINDKAEAVPSETVLSAVEKEMSIDTAKGVALKIPEGKQNLTSVQISTSSSKLANNIVALSASKVGLGGNLAMMKGVHQTSLPEERENKIRENSRTVSTESQISNLLSAVPESSTVVRIACDSTAKATNLPANTVPVRPANNFSKFAEQCRFLKRKAGKCINRRRSLDPCNKQRLLYKDMLGQMRLHRKRSLSEGARFRLLQTMRKSSSVTSTGRKISAVGVYSGKKSTHDNVSRLQGDIPVANMCITNYLVSESDMPIVSKKERALTSQVVERATSTLVLETSPKETDIECSEVKATTADESSSDSSGSKQSRDEALITRKDEAVYLKPESVPPEVTEESMDTSENMAAINVDEVEACGNITDGITDTENSLTSVEEQLSDLTPTESEINNAFSFAKCQREEATCTESASDVIKEAEKNSVNKKSLPESEFVEPVLLMNAEALEDIAEDVSMELPKESALSDGEIKSDDLFMDIEALSSCATGELASFGSITGDAAPTTEAGTEQAELQLSLDVKCVLEEILDRIAKNESGGAAASESTLLGAAPPECELAKLPEATPEEQAEKVSILWALGLTMRHATPPPPPVPKSAPYTGTLKTVIKVQRTSPEKRRRSLKMVLKQGSAPNGRRESGGNESGEEKVEYRICKENELLSGDPSNFGVNNKKLVKNSSHKSFHELSTNSPYVVGGKDEGPTAASGITATEGIPNGAVSGKDDPAKPPVDLIIPEKSASFSIHPGRLCSDVCSYCFGKFGSLDTPCHIAQLKTAERQRKVLEIETHLTAESCLCDACYRHVDRKANCPSYKDNRKRYQRASGALGVTAACTAQGCDQIASHQVRRKWLLKLKRSIMNKVPVDTDKPQAHFPLCSQHFSWVDFYMVCAICNRRLARAHMYSLGNAEARELNAALTRDGIPARVSSERFLCKLCRYYAGLRAKCRNPNNLTGNQKMFFDSYRKRILQYHDIEVPSGSETEEATRQSKESSGQSAEPKPKRRRTKADSSATKETQEGSAKGGDSAANNNARLGDHNGTSDSAPQQGSGAAAMMDYSNLATFGNNLTVTPIPPSSGPVTGRRSSSGTSGGLHTGDEDQPPPVQASFEFHGAGGAPRGGGEWEQCTASLQFTADTKRLFQTLQRPYGSHSSFMRHLLLLEKYWRQGDLVLSPRASHRAATYVSSVQHRLRAFDYNPLQNTSRPQHKPLTSPASASDPARRGLVPETNSVSVIPMGASGEPEPPVLELPLRSPPVTATPLAVQGPQVVSLSPGANSGMRKVILDSKGPSPTGGYMLSVGRGGVLVPTSVMQMGGRTYLYTPPPVSNARRVMVPAPTAAPAPVTAASTGLPVTSPNTSGGSPVVPRISSVRSLAPRAWDRAAGTSNSGTGATTTVSTKSSQPRLSVTVVPKSGTSGTPLPKGSVPGPKPSTIVTPTGIVLSRNLDVTMSPVPPQ